MDRREKDNEGVGDQKEGDDCNGRLFIVKRDGTELKQQLNTQ